MDLEPLLSYYIGCVDHQLVCVCCDSIKLRWFDGDYMYDGRK